MRSLQIQKDFCFIIFSNVYFLLLCDTTEEGLSEGVGLTCFARHEGAIPRTSRLRADTGNFSTEKLRYKFWPDPEIKVSLGPRSRRFKVLPTTYRLPRRRYMIKSLNIRNMVRTMTFERPLFIVKLHNKELSQHAFSEKRWVYRRRVSGGTRHQMLITAGDSPGNSYNFSEDRQATRQRSC